MAMARRSPRTERMSGSFVTAYVTDRIPGAVVITAPGTGRRTASRSAREVRLDLRHELLGGDRAAHQRGGVLLAGLGRLGVEQRLEPQRAGRGLGDGLLDLLGQRWEGTGVTGGLEA